MHVRKEKSWGTLFFLLYLEESDEVCGLEERQGRYVVYDSVQGWVGG